MNAVETYLPLDVLATTLGLPRNYLKKLSQAGQVPFLDVGGRRRYDPIQVNEALRRIAEQTAEVSREGVTRAG